eukprot:TRINITY_DN9767_c0_g1_i1.p2 TRINITY_DN9767_c0_g1~~TRINITY_DN9767_c0_g1_i1.p2  ORF type:complete len:139 (-),score=28.19 TRINITY_DN9767_c0_g1_i1:651-1013(-)
MADNRSTSLDQSPESIKNSLKELTRGIPSTLPVHPPLDKSVPHAIKRPINLNAKETKLALQNALRYFPKEFHSELAPEFANELKVYGHIYMYRFRPTAYEMKAYPIDYYPENVVKLQRSC